MLAALKHHDILYAEDDDALRKTMADYLALYFRKVHTCADGNDALECYRLHRPSVLLLDIDLPGTDGLQIASAVRRDDPHCCIVMLTAYTDTPKLLEAVELQLIRYLVKPVTPAEFYDTLLRIARTVGQRDGSIVCIADLLLWYRASLRLYRDGEEVALTEKERRLLQLLLEHRGRCVEYETIMNALWEDALERDITIDAVKRHTSSLRRKLPECRIESVYGHGYLLH